MCLARSEYLIDIIVIIFNNKLFPSGSDSPGFYGCTVYCGLQLQKRNELDLKEGSEQNL